MTTARKRQTEAQPRSVPVPRAPILVVSRDEGLLPSMQKVLGGSCPLHHTQSMQEAVGLVQKHRFGVLITDLVAEEREVMEITHILSTYSPNLVCIVIADREHGHDLMSLVNSGYIYRFLLKPVAAGQTRLTVQAALRQHHTLRQNPPRPPLPLPESQTEEDEGDEESYGVMDVLEDILEDNEHLRSLFLGGLALVIALALALTWYFSGDSEDEVVVEEPVISEPLTPTSVEPARTEAEVIQPLLQKAGVALQEGRLVTPEQDSALYYYSEILNTEPGNEEANQGLDRLTEIMLARAERSLQEDEFEDAIAFVQTARSIRPEHPGIDPVDTLVHDYGERWLAKAEQSAQAPAATPRPRPTPAPARTPALAPAQREPAPQPQASVPAPRTPPVSAPVQQPPSIQPAPAAASQTPQPEPQLARVEPQPDATARSGQVSTETMINDMSRLANRRMDEGRLLEPPGDSAKFYVLALQQAAPNNTAVARDRDRLAALFLARARIAMADQSVDVAEQWLTEAKALAATTDDLQREFTEPGTQSGAPEPPTQTAQQPPAQTALQVLALQGVPGAPPPRSPQASATPPTVAQTQAQPAPDVSAGIVEPSIPAPVPPTSQEPVPVSELQFKRYVEPKYPRGAFNRSVNGWVDLEFTVSRDGRAKNIRIGQAEPPNQFEDAALDAVRKWQFEPELVDGQPVEKRAKVRVRFQVE